MIAISRAMYGWHRDITRSDCMAWLVLVLYHHTGAHDARAHDAHARRIPRSELLFRAPAMSQIFNFDVTMYFDMVIWLSRNYNWKCRANIASLTKKVPDLSSRATESLFPNSAVQCCTVHNRMITVKVQPNTRFGYCIATRSNDISRQVRFIKRLRFYRSPASRATIIRCEQIFTDMVSQLPNEYAGRRHLRRLE